MIVSVALLVAVYLALGMFADPRGSLGTDTGGKLATLAEMDRQESWTPDIGYWAADADPDGLAHPLYYTLRFDRGYVNVTTLPMLLAARPLHAFGGTRFAGMLPIAGAAACALAGRALARRLGSRRPALAFWAVGLASPVAVYALDLWEHTLGLACIAWAIVRLVDFAAGRGAVAAVSAGLLFGLGATMRTEALLYGAVFSAVVLVLVARRSRGTAVRGALAALVGVTMPLAANEFLERIVLGAPLRSSRASGTAAGVGSNLSVRLEEGLRTTIGANYADLAVDAVVGAVLLGGLVTLAAFGAGRAHRVRHRVEIASAIVVVYALRLRTGLSFVSGLFAATPLAAAALGARRTRSFAHGWLVPTAMACLPMVWAVQYIGGAGPQWGGRYVLASGFVLGTVGTVALERAHRDVRRVFAVVAIGVTAYGCWFAIDRTHDAARLADRVLHRQEDIIVSRVGHVFREVGADYRRDRQWLTAVDLDAIRATREVVDEVRPASIAVITYPGDSVLEFSGYAITATDPLQFFSESLEIRRYERGEP